MTGLVRKATLFGVCAALAATTALANVPDLGQSTVPAYIYVTGTLQNGSNADPFGRGTIVLRDFSGNPLSGRVIKINFRAACDINLCTFVTAADAADYSTQIVCDSSIVRGITDDAGEFKFSIVGGAKAPTHVNTAGSGRYKGVYIFVDDVKFTSVTAISLDQDAGCNGVGGACAGGTAGLGGADLGKLATNVGQVGLGGQYIGRGDINASGPSNPAGPPPFVGGVNGADLGVLAGHVGRYQNNAGGVGCGAPNVLCKTDKCLAPW
jgi:hypothetical protein